MHAIEHAVARPFPEITVDRRRRGKILGQQPPLAARAVQIANGVEDLADIGLAFSATGVRRRDHRLDDGPFGVVAVTWVSTGTRFMLAALPLGPHGIPLIRMP